VSGRYGISSPSGIGIGFSSMTIVRKLSAGSWTTSQENINGSIPLDIKHDDGKKITYKHNKDITVYFLLSLN
jgi:hypothetical protein